MTWHRIDDPQHPPPKDGTQLILYDRVGFIVFGWFDDVAGVWRFFDPEGEYTSEWESGYGPHYWQPLPPPPGDG